MQSFHTGGKITPEATLKSLVTQAVYEGRGGEGVKFGAGAYTEDITVSPVLHTYQDLLERIKGLEVACARLERERGESSTKAEGLKKDVDGLAKRLESAGAAVETTREEIQQKERQSAQVCGIPVMWIRCICRYYCCVL